MGKHSYLYILIHLLHTSNMPPWSCIKLLKQEGLNTGKVGLNNEVALFEVGKYFRTVLKVVCHGKIGPARPI